MNHNIYLCDLYDYYKELLTDKQKMYFEDYYFDNLTLSELSENYNVSRNAIHKTLKEIEVKLNTFEDKLNLYKNREKIKDIISSLDDDIKKRINELI